MFATLRHIISTSNSDLATYATQGVPNSAMKGYKVQTAAVTSFNEALRMGLVRLF